MGEHGGNGGALAGNGETGGKGGSGGDGASAEVVGHKDHHSEAGHGSKH